MKTKTPFFAFILLTISSLAQTTTNTNYYDQYGNKIGSSKGTIIEKPEYKYIPQYVPENLDAQQAYFDRLQKTNDDNLKQVNFLIDWIIDSKSKTNDQSFITALTKYYEQLKYILAQQELQLSETTYKIQQINLGLKDEVDQYNMRQKDLPQKLWDSGKENFKNKKYYEAIKDFTSLVSEQPSFAGAYLDRGLSYFYLGNFEMAIIDFNKFIEMDPTYSIAYSSRGWSKYYQKNYFGALTDFNKQIELEPNSFEAYYNRGSVKSELGDKNGAIADYTKAIELKSNFSMAYNNRGWAKFQLKKYSEALIDLNKAIEYGATNWVAYDSRQETKFALNDFKGCIDDCNKAIELNPKASNSYFIRGRAYYKQGNKTKACEDWSKAGELGQVEAYVFIQKYCNK